jgi:predicted DNA-binding WGR domain protein
MMIVLHKHVPERNQHRFYALQVTPNLFGAWSLIRSWGRIGASGQQRIDWHDTQEYTRRIALHHFLCANVLPNDQFTASVDGELGSEEMMQDYPVHVEEAEQARDRLLQAKQRRGYHLCPGNVSISD